MSNPSLLPEQEELLCKLVEAINRAKPNQSQFSFFPDYTRGGDLALVVHPGWLPGPESQTVIGDLEALDDAGYIRISHMKKGGMFKLTGGASEFYERRLYPDDSNYKTKIPLWVRLDDRDRIEVISEGKVLSLTPMPGVLFLRLILGLKQEKLGWVHKQDLINRHIVTEDGAEQSIRRLRRKLEDLVSPISTKDFIEASAEGSLRVSTPPRLVKCDAAPLLQSNDHVVASLARELPI